MVCFVRTLDELKVLIGHLPAPKPDEKLEVIFYKSDPGPDAFAALAETRGPGDTLTAHGRETIWGHVGAMMESPLAALTPRASSPVTTVRTAGTIERLVSKLE